MRTLSINDIDETRFSPVSYDENEKEIDIESKIFSIFITKKFPAFFKAGNSQWRYRPDLNWGMKVLQTFALPLGHGTI